MLKENYKPENGKIKMVTTDTPLKLFYRVIIVI